MKTYVERSEILTCQPFTELNYSRNYGSPSLMFIFILSSFSGWVWEGFLSLISDGSFINRGFFLGPWLPIYGVCSVLILVLLKRWRHRPLYTLVFTMLLCGTIQYTASVVLETLFHARWWDFGHMLLNINGRACLEGLFIFGLVGLIFIYLVAPVIDGLCQNLSPKFKYSFYTFFTILFILDFIRSCIIPNMGIGITI